MRPSLIILTTILFSSLYGGDFHVGVDGVMAARLHGSAGRVRNGGGILANSQLAALKRLKAAALSTTRMKKNLVGVSEAPTTLLPNAALMAPGMHIASDHHRITLKNSSVQQAAAKDLPVDRIGNGGLSATSTIRAVKIEADKVKIEKANHRIHQALSMVDRLFLMVADDLKGGGKWALEINNLLESSKVILADGRKKVDSSLDMATNALSCARRCGDDVCSHCSRAKQDQGGNKDPKGWSLNLLMKTAEDYGGQAGKVFRKARNGVTEAREYALSARHAPYVGQIIGMARSAAATSLGEIEKWLDVCAEAAEGKWFATDLNIVGENTLAKIAAKDLQKKVEAHAEKRSIELRTAEEASKRKEHNDDIVHQSVMLRGRSEEATKAVRAAKAKEDARLASQALKNPEICTAKMHCKDSAWSLSLIERAGCEHGCARDVKDDNDHSLKGKGCNERCKNKAHMILGSLVEPGDLSEWVGQCANSCKSIAAFAHESIQWREQQLGDHVLVGGGSDEIRSYMDNLNLPKGEGWRCNETQRWKPCLDTCNIVEIVEEESDTKQVQGKTENAASTRKRHVENGLQRSGCIYGCREALLRGITSARYCPQWCDETVDQVMLLPDRYGKDIFKAPLPIDAENAKRTWATSCNHACEVGFDMRKGAPIDLTRPCTP